MVCRRTRAKGWEDVKRQLEEQVAALSAQVRQLQDQQSNIPEETIKNSPAYKQLANQLKLCASLCCCAVDCRCVASPPAL